MATDTYFSIPKFDDAETVTITFEGNPITVPKDISVAAALLTGSVRDFRTSPIGGKPRAPYCMMGVCFECLVEIDGVPARQSCLVQVRDGMQIRRQAGAKDLNYRRGGEL